MVAPSARCVLAPPQSTLTVRHDATAYVAITYARTALEPSPTLERVHTDASESPRYSMSPPPYSPLCGPAARAAGVANNLMASFVTIAMAIKPDPPPGPRDARAAAPTRGTLGLEAESEEDSGAPGDGGGSGG